MSQEPGTKLSISIAASLAIMAMAVVSAFAATLTPLLLAQLHHQGLITLVQIGQAATLELLGMAFGTLLATVLLKPLRLRHVVMTAAAVAITMNMLTVHLTEPLILAARFLAGMPAGVLLWLWVGLLVRVKTPARWVAICSTFVAASSAALVSLFSSVIFPAFGIAGGYISLAIGYGAIGLLAVAIPSKLPPHVAADTRSLPGGRGAVGLLAIALYVAGIMATWTYVAPLGLQVGRPPEGIGRAISIALGWQVIAGLLSAVIASRVNVFFAIVISGIGSIIGVVAMLITSGDGLFLTGVILVAFFWIFAAPFMVPFIIAIDRSGRAPLHVMTVQLFGLAAGPAFASLAVRPQDVSGAMLVGIALFATALSLIIPIWIRRDGSDLPPPSGPAGNLRL